MCTTLAYKTNDFYFCRNMDLDYHFDERVVITPRGYEISYKHLQKANPRYAIIGMATVVNDYPLYAEGANEKGLCVSALNFPGNAVYRKNPDPSSINLAPYEVILYILSNFSTVKETKTALSNACIVNTPFDKTTQTTPLHWHIADKESSIVLESTAYGVEIHENPIGILTNNPPFKYQIQNLSKYNHLKPSPPNKTEYSLGLSAYGLPGDYSSSSRFVRLAYLKKHVSCKKDEDSSLYALLQLMRSVSVPRGIVLTVEGKEHYTIYSAVINATKGIYYFQTDTDLNLNSVNMHNYDLDSRGLFNYNIEK